MARRFELTDAEWERIGSLVPGKAGDPGRTAKDNRLFLDAVLWIARTGAGWRDLPARFGKWDTVHKRFARWCRSGVWERLLTILGPDPDLEAVLLDSTIVRAHPHAAGGKGGQRLRPSAAVEADSARSCTLRSIVSAVRCGS